MVRLWLAALAAVARCDEFGWDDLDLVDVDEDGGPAVTHDDVMRAAESKERYVHSFAFEDLPAWDGALAELVLENPHVRAFALYFYKPGCEHCAKYSPIFGAAATSFRERYPDADVKFVGLNCEESGFEQVGEMYEIVEFPTIVLIEDVYSEPFKYWGGWREASELVDYVAAFADLAACGPPPALAATVGGDDERVAITLGAGLSANERALARVEADRAADRYGVERRTAVYCSAAVTGIVVERAGFAGEPATVVVAPPADVDAAATLKTQAMFRERLRRAVVPRVTEIRDAGDYRRLFRDVEALSVVILRPNATRANAKKAVDAARKLAPTAPEDALMRFVYCRLEDPALDPKANYLCDEMAQYTFPRFNTSGCAGLVVMDVGRRPEPPVSCKTRADNGGVVQTDDDGLTPHMKMILKAKEDRRTGLVRKYGTLRKFALGRSFTRKAGAEFLDAHFRDELKEATLSDKIPDAHLNVGPLFYLVGDTFDDFVATDDDVVVYLVQKDCRSCHHQDEDGEAKLENYHREQGIG